MRFQAKEDIFHIASEHVVYLRESDGKTVIGLSTGKSVKVDGDVGAVLTKLGVE